MSGFEIQRKLNLVFTMAAFAMCFFAVFQVHT